MEAFNNRFFVFGHDVAVAILKGCCSSEHLDMSPNYVIRRLHHITNVQEQGDHSCRGCHNSETSVLPATRENEAEESLEPGRRRLQ